MVKELVITPIQRVEHKEVIYNLVPDAANDDWLRAARLKAKAVAGDAEAQVELAKLEAQKAMREVDV